MPPDLTFNENDVMIQGIVGGLMTAY